MNRHRWSGWWLILLAALATGCASTGAGGDRASNCAVYDSLYANSGFNTPLTLTGKATVDVDQQRIRGIIRAEFYPSGDIYFDFSSSLLFGSQIEDFFVSITGDTLRIVDRERGNYFVGEEAADFLSETLGMDFDVIRTLRLVAGGHPDCERLESIELKPASNGSMRLSGVEEDESWSAWFERGHLARLESPLPGDGRRPDRLTAEYRWSNETGRALEQLTMRLERRRWRCRLTANG